MKIIDLRGKKNEKTTFKIQGIVKNPNNNCFLIFGLHFLKVYRLKENGDFIEEKNNRQRKPKSVKCATWGRKNDKL